VTVSFCVCALWLTLLLAAPKTTILEWKRPVSTCDVNGDVILPQVCVQDASPRSLFTLFAQLANINVMYAYSTDKPSASDVEPANLATVPVPHVASATCLPHHLSSQLLQKQGIVKGSQRLSLFGDNPSGLVHSRKGLCQCLRHCICAIH
jgi:hypothetical protein